MQCHFQAPEYTGEQRFQWSQYHYQGDEHQGWEIIRNNKIFLTLGPGYRLVQSRFCGICATDLARARLPFPLPQITGHEVAGLWQGSAVVMDINASHQNLAHGVESCPYCSRNLGNHCPQRLTLGIDRLPGGFAPFVLAPRQGMVAAAELPLKLLTVVEPLAAACRAVEITPPNAGERIAVLGAGRLGCLLIAALDHYRRRHSLDFDIWAVSRSKPAAPTTALLLGADKQTVTQQVRQKSFHTVFETSGHPQGLQLALQLAKHRVHLKSTHGRPLLGFDQWTALVIKEQSLQPLHNQPVETPAPARAGDFQTGAVSAVAASLQDLNGCLDSVQPGGTILLDGRSCQHPLFRFLHQNPVAIQSSRCGSFPQALRLLRENPEWRDILEHRWIQAQYPLSDIETAFEHARRPGAMKVVIAHE